jgi:DNA-binding HxlR family transcriptional regulator
MSNEDQGSIDTSKAELFDALGHPTRIKILEILSNSQLRFSDLKKALEIENSGLLQFHLGKLQGLVKNSPEGNYSLTDEGREALRVVAIKESAKPAPERKRDERMSNIGLVIAGFIFILMGIGAAMGAVSLGTYQFTTSSGSSAGSYLVYNPFYELLGIFFAGCGGGLLYFTGKERLKEAKK